MRIRVDHGQPIVTSSPDILSGTPVFAGTRVPVQALIDYLEGGETIDDFLAGSDGQAGACRRYKSSSATETSARRRSTPMFLTRGRPAS